MLNVFAWQEVFSLAGNNNLKVYFFDIGQGDAIFIETPGRHQILVDGGPDSAILEKLGNVMPGSDKTIDLVVLTHPEKDHMQGLIDVFERYEIDYILWTGVLRKTQEYQKWLEVLKEEQKQGAEIIIANPEKSIKAGNVFLDIIHPFDDLSEREMRDSNDSSIVFNLIFRKNKFLFTGDITNKTEEGLINSGVSLQSDVLKVAHHGSKYSSSEDFLGAVNPAVSVISAGKENFYGHPAPEVLQRLEKSGIKVKRTDKEGDIEIVSDGENIKIK